MSRTAVLRARPRTSTYTQPERRAFDVQVTVSPAGETFGKRRRHAWDRSYRALDLPRQVVDDLKVGAGDLDPHRALDAGGEHIDPVAYRRHPDVGQPWHLHHPIELLHELVRCHPGAPLPSWPELDGGLEHLERRGIGGRLGASHLAEHARHFGHSLDEPVGLLQQLRDLARRNAGQGW